MHSVSRRLMLALLGCFALLIGSCGSSEQGAGTPSAQTTTTTASANASRSTAHPGLLLFYDWEENVLAPDGRTVASQLAGQDVDAQRISQASGDPSQGQTLYDAVKLASEQRAITSDRNGSRIGSAYYLFDRDRRYLAGPERSREDLRTASDRADLPAGSEALAVPQGFVVVQAISVTADDKASTDDPSARFYVLRDRVALSGEDIKDPQQGFNELQAPVLEFMFTDEGKRAFHDVTREISQRGTELRLPGVDPRQVLQHFAVALDGRLISVASIDPQALPDGIDGETGALIEGGFTIQSARDLANLIRGDG